MTRVELFEQIRLDFYRRGKKIRAIARERRVGRKTVRAALASARPPDRRVPERERSVFTDAHRRLVDEWLRADLDAPRKQRHTAVQVFRRLGAETAGWTGEEPGRIPFRGAESTVRAYVSRRRAELGLATREAHVPLAHPPGEAEVDWYEAVVRFPDGERRVYIFQMRACHSGREFHMAFPRMTQQAFLEGHVAAFLWFGGVFPTIRYDNLKSAVRKVLTGRRRIESNRFVLLRSHFGFEAVFCGVGKGHEKGGVESGVGRFRRTHLVPVPAVPDFAALNRRLREACAEDEGRIPKGRHERVADAWLTEQPTLLAAPEVDIDLREIRTLSVGPLSLIKVDTNRYSVPVALAHREVEVRVGALELEVWHGGRLVARHARLLGRGRERLVLDHYLELLDRKPGAFAAARPLAESRRRGEWTAEFDRMLAGLMERCGEAKGTRHMIRILMLLREHAREAVVTAVGLAVEYGTFGHQAVRQLVGQLERDAKATPPLDELGDLAAYDRPPPDTLAWDRLLSVAVIGVSPLALIMGAMA